MGTESTEYYWLDCCPICLMAVSIPTTGVKLTGQLNGWVTPKDVILHLAGMLTVRVRFSILFFCLTSRSERAALEVYWSTSDRE